jgi:hypothetical protein
MVTLVVSAAVTSLASSASAARGPDCARSSVGLVPLTQLGTATYEGEVGGLYPNGTNKPPAKYQKAGRRLAARVVPRNPKGRPTERGKIALVSIGMSNTALEFNAFRHLVEDHHGRNRRVVLVDGAQDGQSADRWVSPEAEPWAELNQRLAEANVSPQQVQAVWLKEADANPTTGFAEYVATLESEMASIVRIAASKFRNLRQVFVSPRTYGGYATTTLNPEPYAYWSGFAAKRLVAASVARPTTRPWVGWGPYIWTDGTTPSPNGLVWTCEDVATNGVHPSKQGAMKIAELLQSFLRQSNLTPWYRSSKA